MWLSENVSVYKASGHSLSLREAYASNQTMHGPVAKTLAFWPRQHFFFHNLFPSHRVLQRTPVPPPTRYPLGHELNM